MYVQYSLDYLSQCGPIKVRINKNSDNTKKLKNIGTYISFCNNV